MGEPETAQIHLNLTRKEQLNLWFQNPKKKLYAKRLVLETLDSAKEYPQKIHSNSKQTSYSISFGPTSKETQILKIYARLLRLQSRSITKPP